MKTLKASSVVIGIIALTLNAQGFDGASEQNAEGPRFRPEDASRTAVRKMNQDGECANKQNMERKQAMLEKFDTDGDGKLSEEEKAEARKAMQEKKQQREERMLKRFDADGDGQLSDAEKAEAKKQKEQMQEKMKKAGVNIEEIRKQFDADGDGQLSEQERAQARKAMQEKNKSGETNGPLSR